MEGISRDQIANNLYKLPDMTFAFVYIVAHVHDTREPGLAISRCSECMCIQFTYRSHSVYYAELPSYGNFVVGSVALNVFCFSGNTRKKFNAVFIFIQLINSVQ